MLYLVYLLGVCTCTSGHHALHAWCPAGVPVPADPEDPTQADKARQTKQELFGLLMTPAGNAGGEQAPSNTT